MSPVIADALHKIEELINNKSTVTNPEELEKLEEEIVQATDQLARVVIVLILQQALDNQERPTRPVILLIITLVK